MPAWARALPFMHHGPTRARDTARRALAALDAIESGAVDQVSAAMPRLLLAAADGDETVLVPRQEAAAAELRERLRALDD